MPPISDKVNGKYRVSVTFLSSAQLSSLMAPEWFDDADVIDAIREDMAKFEAAKPDTGERPAITLNEVGL